MSIDIVQLVYKTLKSNSTICNQLAKNPRPIIGINKTVRGIYPQLELHQVEGEDSLHADDDILTERSVIAITYFTEESADFYKIFDTLKQLMRNINFKMVVSFSAVDTYTGITKFITQWETFYNKDTISYYAKYLPKMPPVQQTLPKGRYFDEKTREVKEI